MKDTGQNYKSIGTVVLGMIVFSLQKTLIQFMSCINKS